MTLIAFLALQILCATAGADERLQRPEYERTEPVGTELIANEIPLQTYTLTEYKKLGLLITDYHELWRYVIKQEAKIASMEIQMAALRNQVEIWKAAAGRSEKYNVILKAMYTEERDLRLSAQKGHRRTKWIPWAVVVAQSVAMAAVAISD